MSGLFQRWAAQPNRQVQGGYIPQPRTVACTPPPRPMAREPIAPVDVTPAPQQVGVEGSDYLPSPIQASQPILDPEHVTRLVSATDAIPQVTRSGGNKDGYMHVSSLIGACAREHTISHQHGLPTARSVAGPMKVMWKIGRVIEAHIRNSVIHARNWTGVWGRWVCRCGASEHLGEHPRDARCPHCNRGLSRYREPLLFDDDDGVVGSPDLTLIEMGFIIPVEIKSMNKEQFDELDAPLADHVLQVMSYRLLYQRMGFTVMDKAIIVYVRKDFKFGGSRAVYKEFHVDFRVWEAQILSMMAMGRAIKDANEANTLITRTVCSVHTCARAKGCERASLCFSM